MSCYLASLLVGLETGNKLLVDCGYLMTQLLSLGASIVKVAASFSPFVFSVTLYYGMGKVCEIRDSETY